MVAGRGADRSPLGVTYDLTPAWTTAARALAKALDAQLMLGLNLEANRTRIPQQEATQFIRRIGARYLQSFPDRQRTRAVPEPRRGIAS